MEDERIKEIKQAVYAGVLVLALYAIAAFLLSTLGGH